MSLTVNQGVAGLIPGPTVRKVPKFSDTRKHPCNVPKIQTRRPNLMVFRLKVVNGITNSEDPDQTAPDLDLHCFLRPGCPKT